jgi:hypothetical protein
MRRRNEAVGAARSGFFGAQWSTGVAAGSGFPAADLAVYRLIGAARSPEQMNKPPASAIPARAAPVLLLCVAQNKLEPESLRYL